MSIGMTYEQYWYGDVRATKSFVEADKLYQERMNTEAWLQAMYVYDAISRLFPLPVGFLEKNSGIKQRDYIEEPYKLFTRDEERKGQTTEEEDADALRAELYMRQMVRAGGNWGKGGA